MMAGNRKDYIWILTASALILLWSSIPTWAGYRAQTRELRFRGIYFDSQDYAVHIATMEAGRQGEWAYQFRFTTESHNPAFVRMFYVVLGHLSKWLGLTSEFTFQAARWLLGFVALFALYKLMQRVFPDLFWARVAFLLAALGSGLGWLQLIFNSVPGRITPIDFWLIDDYVFFSLSVFPHFVFVTAGMCVALTLWLDFLEKPRWTHIVWIGLTAILVQLVNPIAFATVDAGLVGATVFAWWGAKKIRGADIIALLIIAITQVPLFAYNFIVLNNDPLWRQFTAQNRTLSPPPSYYFWGFAFFWPLAFLGTHIALRNRSKALGAVLFWVIVAFILAYAPVYIQRRFLQNITIPLAILATTGLISLFERLAIQRPGMPHMQKSWAILFVFLASISSIQLSLGRAAYLQTHPEDFYYPVSLDDAIKWFRGNAQPDDFVLASEETSQIIAQKAGLRVYFGHEMETLDYKTKQINVQAFFRGELPELAGKPIQWVVYGPFERKLGVNFRRAENLEQVYETPELQIYRVK
ncbi:MAG TPA: hypothetical protein VK206_14190 [Anaerolineales bacterium]|nr:hypothetical protein [Anaerolineales bacterium]HLO28985.1 hypothetical protein [Anaerolineales bacterium]